MKRIRRREIGATKTVENILCTQFDIEMVTKRRKIEPRIQTKK